MNQSQFMNKQDKDTERLVNELHGKIDNLKTQYNLFFTRELKVPPEKEREEMEKIVKKMLTHEQRSPRMNLILQNLSSKFLLYNNLWKKRMNEVETGVISLPEKSSAQSFPREEEIKPAAAETAAKEIMVNLNNEDTFEFFAREFAKIVTNKSSQKDKIINNLKSKMISENIINAKINLSVQNGKVKIKLKRSI